MSEEMKVFLDDVFLNTAEEKVVEDKIFETYLTLHRNTLLEWATEMGIKNRYAMRKADLVRYVIIEHRILNHKRNALKEYGKLLDVKRPYHKNKEDIMKAVMGLKIELLESVVPGIKSERLLDDLSKTVFNSISLSALKEWARDEGFKGYSLMNHHDLSKLAVIEYRLRKKDVDNLRMMAKNLNIEKTYKRNKKQLINLIIKKYIELKEY